MGMMAEPRKRVPFRDKEGKIGMADKG